MRNSELDGVWPDFSHGNIDAVAHTLGTNNEQALQQVANKLIKDSDNLLVGIWRFSFDVLAFAFLALLVLVGPGRAHCRRRHSQIPRNYRQGCR
jgi:DNA-binding MurR/RpiR family transcriptional regulator